ncbi:MAG: UDP-N-acetylmuramoyl-L-alanine--D-glutamate ligase [Cytophagales bacterium]|nr:UDP-N-acetylmuramoyl-L-alanine--D-glutamate ligase [Cytophagales bacterium]
MKKIVILGAGESGTGAALLAKAKGLAVFVSDAGKIASHYKEELCDHNIAFEEGGHSWEKVRTADEIVKSPGIPDSRSLIQAIKEAGIPIIGEVELAARYAKAFLIAITGTNGKTTTTHLTYHLLKAVELNVGMAGNMGQSFARQVIKDKFDYYVLELSSFQLEGMRNFKANIAALLNITPDHLDRYGYQFANYIHAKFSILQNMTANDHFIYFQEDPNIQDYLKATSIVPIKHPISFISSPSKGAYEQNGRLYFALAKKPFSIPVDATPLVGKHNWLNTMVAIAIASLVDIDQASITTSLKTFQGLPHRLAWVATIRGIDFYNDAKATNVEAASVALSSFDQSIIWIAGGQDKGNDYTSLQPIVKAKVKAIICLGKDNTSLRKAFEGVVPAIYETQHVEEVIKLALSYGKSGDVVLLSPACASFDLFNNFEERGECFAQAVYQAKKFWCI